MNSYHKFIEEVDKNGLAYAMKKSIKHISRKTEKIHINNIIDSFKVLMSENNIIVYWWNSLDNFGDTLNPILIKKLFKKNAYHPNKIINFGNKTVYSAIGSILQIVNYKKLEIWGSGFIDENGFLKCEPVEIHAVRGPLTRMKLIKQGFSCPEVYGDPGLLVPKFYNPKVKKIFKLGIVAHYVDKDNKIIKVLKDKYKEDILFIDIQGNWREVIDNINKCEIIASSSLHGIITADAYNIPSLWIKLSDKVSGGNFKFHDYMLSVGRKQMEPFLLNREYKLIDIINSVEDYKINIDLEKLINSCPFKDIKNN